MYPVDFILYHFHFAFLFLINLIKNLIEVRSEFVAIVHQVMIIQYHLTEPIRFHLGVIMRGLLDEPVARHTFEQNERDRR